MTKSRRMIWAGRAARMMEKMNAYKLLVGKPEGKMQLSRSKHRWLDNIKMDLGKIGWGGMEYIYLA
jgi:hypothetical protein